MNAYIYGLLLIFVLISITLLLKFDLVRVPEQTKSNALYIILLLGVEIPVFTIILTKL